MTVYLGNLSSLSNASLEEAYASCSSHKTCDECLKSSFTCHFCESDFQCHAIPRGCLVGMSTCHHLEDCLRKEPQYVGYGPPPSVVIAVLCLVVTLACCLCGISAMCSVFCQRQRSPTSPMKDKVVSPKTSDPLLHLEGEEEVLVYEETIDPPAMEPLRHVYVSYVLINLIFNFDL